jgi:hypothetical protein
VHPNASAGPWSTEQLQLLDAAVELNIAVPRPDGALGRWTTVWVVCVGQGVFVRSWHRRETGWFGRAVTTGRARIRAIGLETDVAVVDLGRTGDRSGEEPQLQGELFDEVDSAYRTKYGAFGDATVGAMVSAHARVTTLRLDRR